MHRLKMLVIFCLSLAAYGQCAIWLETSWNQELSNTELALTDGYRWTGVTGGNALNMLKVEPGGVAGNNVMGIWLDNAAYAQVVHNKLPIREYDDFYYRFYLKVYPKNGIRYPNFHGISNQEVDGSSNFYFMVRDEGNVNAWDCRIGTYTSQSDGMQKAYAAGGLAFNEWYRVEGHIRWFNHKDWGDTSIDGKGVPATLWLIRIYDSNNQLVRDESNFTGAVAGGVSLKAEYAAGKKFYLNGNTSSFVMGTNGPYGGTGQGRVHDVCAVALGNDPSVWGPVTGKVAATDNIKPVAHSFYPLAGATSVLPSAAINLTLKEIGKGLDTTSIVYRLNGQTVKPNGNGSLWSYKLFYKPPVAMPAGDLVTIRVQAKDLASPANLMDTTYSFTVAGVSSMLSQKPVYGKKEAASGVFFTLLGQRFSAQKYGERMRKTNMPYLVISREDRPEIRFFPKR